MIKQIALPLRGRPILLITRMITDRIGLRSVLLPLQIKRFLEIYLSLLFVLVEETPKVKRKRKKQKSLELEEGTHLVAEPFCLICKTPVETL